MLGQEASLVGFCWTSKVKANQFPHLTFPFFSLEYFEVKTRKEKKKTDQNLKIIGVFLFFLVVNLNEEK